MTNLQRTKQAYAEIDAFIEILPEDKKRNQKFKMDLRFFLVTNFMWNFYMFYNY